MKKFSEYHKLNEKLFIDEKWEIDSMKVVGIDEDEDFSYKLEIKTKDGHIFYGKLKSEVDYDDED